MAAVGRAYSIGEHVNAELIVRAESVAEGGQLCFGLVGGKRDRVCLAKCAEGKFHCGITSHADRKFSLEELGEEVEEAYAIPAKLRGGKRGVFVEPMLDKNEVPLYYTEILSIKRKVGKDWEETFAMIARDIARRAKAKREESGELEESEEEEEEEQGQEQENLQGRKTMWW